MRVPALQQCLNSRDIQNSQEQLSVPDSKARLQMLVRAASFFHREQGTGLCWGRCNLYSSLVRKDLNAFKSRILQRPGSSARG